MLLAAVWLAGPAEAQVPGESRLALVIGNAAYRNAPLHNPVNDARLMESVLRDAGFEVMKAENASLREMRRLLRDFGDRLRQRGGIGLFYFAGHGLQVRGENYLVSVDSDIRNEDEVADDAMNAQLVLEKMQSANNRLNVVILDACRNNPFAVRTRSTTLGLATMHAPSGSIIAYSTAPGSVALDGSGANGLYTRHLAHAIPQPGLAIEEVFKQVRAAVRRESNNQQVPWENTALEGQFFFKAGPAQAALAAARPQAAPAPAAAPAAATHELAFWDTVKNSGSARELQSYLDRYPNGEFVAIARSRLASLTPPPAAPVPAAAPARPAPVAPVAVPQIPAAQRLDGTVITGSTRLTGRFVQDGNVYSGTGKLEWANGDVFEGTLDKGKLHGFGRFVWSNGQAFEGNWQHDQLSGKAKLKFADGTLYEGLVVDGRPHGEGKMTFPSGGSYTGVFEAGQPHGSGVLVFSTGSQYTGPVSGGLPHGEGRMVFADGHVYEGTFRAGVQEGQGVFKWKHGDEYSGQWRGGLKEGRGVFIWRNGDRWEGVYRNDQQTEQGQLTRK